MNYLILPSLLSADVTRLGDEVDAVLKAGADYIHFDVMDNHYVPNLTFGPLFCDALVKRDPNILIDVHLMVQPVDALIEAFAKAGAKRISIHPDATIHLDRSLQLIRDLGCEAGLVFNPATSLELLPWCIHHLSFVLVMTVNPGFGGQKFMTEMMSKVSRTRALIGSRPIWLQVDGGISTETIEIAADAGADTFVAGSAVFKAQDPAAMVTSLRELASKS